MSELFRNSRFYVLAASLLFSCVVYVFVLSFVRSDQLQIIRLNQIYGLTSLILLYFALLAGPVCYVFSGLSFKKQYLHARRAIGVAAFYFGVLHTWLAFFGQLGGFEGLGFLSANYITAIGLGIIALFILMLLAVTSFDAVITKMTFPNWKLLHRFVYIAGILILIHALMLGTHFSNLSSVIPQVFFVMLAVLFILEANRFDVFLLKKFPRLPRFGIIVSLLFGFLIFWYVYTLLPSNVVQFGIHNQHKQTMQELQNTNMSFPGMKGDRTLRYTAGFEKPETVIPHQPTQLSFSIYNANNGNQVRLFQNVYSKPAHLVVVDNELKYFKHIHPQQDGNKFMITNTFPHPGFYRLYLSYQPVGAIEQQAAFSFWVGETEEKQANFFEQSIDTNFTKTIGNYEITMDAQNKFSAQKMTNAEQVLLFTLYNKKTKQPVTTLKPYLNAFGHLVMINQENYTYIHVHPKDLTVPKPEQMGGPVVVFLPMGMYGPIKPGVYRVFAEFNPDGQLIVGEYTIKVEN